MKLNENIALSKSILNKVGITTESPEYEDYLKIRDLCNTNHGYVGILTKIRFQDGISDMDEIKSIFDILKGSKIDVGKLNKMSYDDILNIFYDELKTTGTDYEIVFKDSEYTYYKVNTYKGILKTASPSWCLKTKSMWDKYQSLYPIQFVVVNNRYKNRLPVPDDDVLETYSSKKGWVRFGVSVKKNGDGSISYNACDDRNVLCKLEPASWTFFGVMCTIMNILKGDNKSYYDKFYGCQKVEGSKTWHKIVNKEAALSRLKIPDGYFKNDVELYLLLSESYSYYPIMLALDHLNPRGIYPVDKVNDLEYTSISGQIGKKVFEDYAKRSDDILYSGVKLKLGTITLDEVKAYDRFIKQVDNWIVFKRNDNYYIVVNSKPDEYNIPCVTFTQEEFDIDKEPVSFYLRKSDLKPVSMAVKELPIHEYHQKVIDALKEPDPKLEEPKEEPKEKKVKGFFDFLKKK
jgi:hypothetical protein